eukprot:CAMPEP_0172316464 /NCGR_PEP_ID=MMETSP1058-20130122/28332_1 /TAXON_ID=83371 /ORGANISM="Detonula confervacea, Strain CCMP 353" /LENGTH=326 /DNA_ID=CAMNT_0013030779 /DNA_START=13 /DNA_END=993 /DNA_ORIENTATION=+
MMETPLLSTILLLLAATTSHAFSAGKGFGSSPSSSNAYVSFDRFKASCPSDVNAIRQFDPSLLKDNNDHTEKDEEDVWVAVYRSANNLPSVFVRDAFMDAMKVSTTVQEGDSETLVSSSSSLSASIASGVINNSNNGANAEKSKPVAVARLGKDEKSNCYIIDSMRCALTKENTDDDCDGGSEHAEAIGVCIDELVLSFLQRYIEKEGNDKNGEKNEMRFDGGIHFRGTLVSGKLLDSRGFREVSELSSDMHSHESDFDGALARYADRSTSKEVAKNPGARERALKIVSYLGRVDWDEDQRRGKQVDIDDEEESDFDPWASVKKFY